MLNIIWWFMELYGIELNVKVFVGKKMKSQMISYASFIDLSPPLSLWHFFSQLSHVGPDNFFPQIVILGLLFVNFTNCPPSKLNCTFANCGSGPRFCILTNCCFRQLAIIFSCGSRSLFFWKSAYRHSGRFLTFCKLLFWVLVVAVIRVVRFWAWSRWSSGLNSQISQVVGMVTSIRVIRVGRVVRVDDIRLYD